jgi:leucine dehydrogenase
VAVGRPLAGEPRRAVLHRYGRIVAALRGTYACGPDLGTTPEDMRTVNDETEHAHGWDRRRNQPLDPGPYTALGVFLGIRAALRQVYGRDDLHGRSVLIQGVGDVGVPLARRLHDAGAALALSDIDHHRAQGLASELGADVVAPDAVPAHPCDVYAPCAVGGTVHADTVPLLRCRIVAGSANNQLGEAADADRLHERGILYAPDYVINGGGAAALPYLSVGDPEASVLERVHGIEGRLDAIFLEARSRGESPAATARRMVDRVLADGRGRKGVRAR